MSALRRDRDPADRGSRITTSDLTAKKRRSEPIVMVIAYDFPSAQVNEQPRGEQQP